MGVTPASVSECFARRGWSTRFSGKRIVRAHEASAFRTLTMKSAYWLGFLLADGYLRIRIRRDGQRTGLVVVILGLQDKQHAEKLARVLGGQCRQEQAYWRVSSRVSPDWLVLEKYGFGDCKTRRLRWPIIADPQTRHLVRGFLDGDGWVTIDRGRGVAGWVSVSREFLLSLQECLTKHGIESLLRGHNKLGPYNIKGVRGWRTVPCFKLIVRKRDSVRKLYRYLYKNVREEQLLRKRIRLLIGIGNSKGD